MVTKKIEKEWEIYNTGKKLRGSINWKYAELGFLVLIFLLFRHKISEFRINCFKFTQYFAKISRLIFIIIIRESFVTNASK